MRHISAILWAALAVGAAVCLGVIAGNHGEAVNSLWLVAAAICIFLLGFRFYAKFIAAKVMVLDDRRATPAERLRDGLDFEPTNKWILFGHHFAAIAGPGLWLGRPLPRSLAISRAALDLVWSCAGGCGAGFRHLVLFHAARRQNAGPDGARRDRQSRWRGGAGNGAADYGDPAGGGGIDRCECVEGQPLGHVHHCNDHPDWFANGALPAVYKARQGTGTSVFGFFLVMLSVYGGRLVGESAVWANWFTLSGEALTFAIILYGFSASALPVWLLLAPRDYLSTFVKLGVVFLLAIGIFFTHPQLQLPPLTRFVDGTGPIFAGKVFPFCFITIACGAISGFHSLISSGTTPKMVAKEWHAWPIGYGAMLLEGFVAIMAMVAAASLQPGVYFAVNSPAGVVGRSSGGSFNHQRMGFPVTADTMAQLAHNVGEKTLFGRTGGAPSLALGMAQIFGSVVNRTGSQTAY